MTIKRLIDRQLGELPESNDTWYCPNCGPLLPESVTYNECCNFCGKQLSEDTQINAFSKEQSRRELLERLIKMNVEKYNICLNTAYEMGEIEDEAEASAESYCEDISYIEKTVFLSWEEIIKALED